MERDRILSILRDHPELRETFGVESLSLFGSSARDEARPDSDVDLLVQFDSPATFDRYMGLRMCLEDLLGVKVDLVTTKGLRDRLRAGVEAEAVPIVGAFSRSG